MASPTLEAAIGGDLEETPSTTPDMVHQLVRRARGAQAVFEQFPQERVDAIVRDFAKYVYDNAELVAGMAHKETGLGVYDDKVLKAKGQARVIWNNLKGKKSRGIIGEDDEQNLVLIAKPMGVVGAVCPVTNPIVTPMCNAMFAEQSFPAGFKRNDVLARRKDDLPDCDHIRLTYGLPNDRERLLANFAVWGNVLPFGYDSVQVMSRAPSALWQVGPALTPSASGCA